MALDGQIGTFVAIITAAITYRGLRHPSIQNMYMFRVDEILIDKDYYRLLSSGFVHANWLHFGFNMAALISFASILEIVLGIKSFLIIYVLSMLGGSLLSLYIHRNHADYSAVGASGAVSGIVASSIILFPFGEIGLLFIPIEIKSWIFGLIFILISILGIKSQSDNIGHEAHLGGLLTGIITTCVINPTKFVEYWWIVLIMAVPIVFFIALIVQRPDILITGKWNLIQVESNTETDLDIPLDQILDKIKKSGFESLSKKERKLLDQYSKEK